MQSIPPGSRLLRFAGDTLRLALTLSEPCHGTALLRTNIGGASRRRREQIAHVERDQPVLECDWHDVPMRRVDDTHWELTIGLESVGRFEAKACFLPERSHRPVWPEGDNVIIKVEPADTVCGNGLYTVFVRQFGPNLEARDIEDGEPAATALLDHAGYTVIPRSGRFRDVIPHLDHIVHTLGFRWLHLLPIHPVPTTYARMGRFGSPFAPLNFRDVDPALAEFDRRTTPLQQFGELVSAVHARDARIALDIPANHTGWASHIQVEHPEWFKRTGDHRFKSPGAWGVTWEDLAELEYRGNQPLWRHMADVFLFWCEQGVDGFRCDAGYMVPYDVWVYIVARVRERFPDTVFLLEGLGGPLATTSRLLDEGGLNWAYSELFQVEARDHLASYLPGVFEAAHRGELLVHFAETHDNNRLAARSPAFARMRIGLCALCAQHGAFGITNGAEWLATDKVDVHEAVPLSWGSDPNLIDWIARLNALHRRHPAFRRGSEVRWLETGGSNAAAVVRRGAGHAVLGIANLDTHRTASVWWSQADIDLASPVDLLGAQDITVTHRDGKVVIELAPGQVCCLAERAHEASIPPMPDARLHQRARAQALHLRTLAHGVGDLGDVDMDAEAASYLDNPGDYWRALAPGGPAALSFWNWPEDQHRVLPVPLHHALLITAPHPFTLTRGSNQPGQARWSSMPAPEGHALLVPPVPEAEASEEAFSLDLHAPGTPVRTPGQLLWLESEEPAVRYDLPGQQSVEGGAYALLTNGRGAMAQVRADWGDIASQYDALLAANLHSAVPVDRHVMLTRCRAWVVYQGYSSPLNGTCLTAFARDKAGVTWRFNVPSGHGRAVSLRAHLCMEPGQNRIALRFDRDHLAVGDGQGLPDEDDVTLILRPDIEDRNHHAKTKAYAGPETDWPQAVAAEAAGFRFTPAPDRQLRVAVEGASYHHEPEWTYMVGHPHEAQRGLDDTSDLFSPGYLECRLRGGEGTTLIAEAGSITTPPSPSPANPETDRPVVPMLRGLRRAMDDFVVARDQSLTVIAGYPWFLDWGRDTLICLRGMIAAGMTDACREILLQFARFEDRGTLPNMIRGEDDSDRDTSDAPLWLIVATGDLLNIKGQEAILETDCRGRSMAEVLRSIGHHYREGTPNGIRMDPESGLIYSPSHFTWMDTNYPAGTPRQGYPIEIQALWHRALQLLERLEPDGDWSALAAQVRASIHAYYPITDRHGVFGSRRTLSDCLHAHPGQPASEAEADDHLRSNQLLAITLGAIEDPDLAREILDSTATLLIPGGIRSLADQPVSYPLPVSWHGNPVNDPHRPFYPHYAGDEDTSRKPAYHNGTAWTWPFPSYSEALIMVYGASAHRSARALLTSSAARLQQGCLGQIPEIMDGASPHQERGCGAQAWGVTELYRVLSHLT